MVDGYQVYEITVYLPTGLHAVFEASDWRIGQDEKTLAIYSNGNWDNPEHRDSIKVIAHFQPGGWHGFSTKYVGSVGTP